eukprot:PITA_32254
MLREKDFAWAYCDKIPGDPKLLCKFCKEKCSGGIYRFKFHLAQIPGHDIGLCNKVDDNVKHQATLAIDMLRQHNAKKAKQNSEIETLGVDSFSSTTPLSPPCVESSMSFPSFPHMPPSPSQTQGQMSPSFNTGGGNINTFFSPCTKPGSQPTSDANVWKKNIHSQTRKAIANFWYYFDIPFHCARSPYWQAMVHAVVVASPGFKAPTSESLRIDLLLESVEDVMLVLADFRSSWVETGCTIMSDGWTDQRNRTLIDFLVSCPAGTMLLKSVDASDKVKTAQLICEMMEEVVQEVGEEHVVQIVTDNAANYMAAERLFEIRHPIIFGPLVLPMKLMVDGDKPAMGYIYEAMDLAKEAIKRRYGDDETKYMPLWDIIDACWDRQLNSPLHAAGYFLNPQYFYDKSKFNDDGEVGKGLMACMERCFPDPKFQSRVFSQLQDYRVPSKLFAYTSVIRERSKMLSGLDHSPIDLEEIDLQTTNVANWVQLEEAPLLSLHKLENFESQANEGVGGIASSSHS